MPHESIGAPNGSTHPGTDRYAAAEAWIALRRYLENKNRDINAEVTRYPTPIARCDVQLSKLLEQRANVYRELTRMGEIGEPASDKGSLTSWIRAVDHFISEVPPDREDEEQVSLRADLIRAIWALNRRISP